MASYLTLMYLVSLGLGYVLAFTQATLFIGKALSDAGTPTGYQDAITPPNFAKFAMLVYAVGFASIAYGIWAFGFLVGLGTAIGLLLATSINIAILLPKKDGQHFRKLIIHSLINRHADYLKSNDALRASVLAEFLEKLDVPVEKFATSMGKHDGA
ncbi:hypothetical protein [Geothrix alkalitolerans]|uniref:hypothetical protein n=1 Tax=Geothrix alkalitolerans TaxID=2922724 RepID=UPI001FAF1494|nr:hypothetical protein [Geothrix alkalitolerans]